MAVFRTSAVCSGSPPGVLLEHPLLHRQPLGDLAGHVEEEVGQGGPQCPVVGVTAEAVTPLGQGLGVQVEGDGFLAGEVAEERRPGDTGLGGDVLHAHCVEPALADQAQRGGADGAPGLELLALAQAHDGGDGAAWGAHGVLLPGHEGEGRPKAERSTSSHCVRLSLFT
jgi:hypothetical protein